MFEKIKIKRIKRIGIEKRIRISRFVKNERGNNKFKGYE
jgi:hypothetical protein